MVCSEGSNVTTDMELFQTICKFSECFGVSYPESNDIGVWWNLALQEMDEEWLYFLYEKGFCANSTSRVEQSIRQRLEDRVKELKH